MDWTIAVPEHDNMPLGIKNRTSKTHWKSIEQTHSLTSIHSERECTIFASIHAIFFLLFLKIYLFIPSSCLWAIRKWGKKIRKGGTGIKDLKGIIYSVIQEIQEIRSIAIFKTWGCPCKEWGWYVQQYLLEYSNRPWVV